MARRGPGRHALTATAPAGAPSPRGGRSGKPGNVISAVVGAIVTVGGFFLVINWFYQPSTATRPPGPGISGTSQPGPGAPAPGLPILPTRVPSQDAPLGSPLQLDFQTLEFDATVSRSTAVMQLDRIQQLPPGLAPEPSGSYYAVEVKVASVKGVVPINPALFSARTNVSTNVSTTYVDIQNLLPTTELPQGQKLAGWICFDVPRGQTIKEIVLEEFMVGQLGRWLVG